MISLKYGKMYTKIAGGYEDFTILGKLVSKPARPIDEGKFDAYMVRTIGGALKIASRANSAPYDGPCEYIGIAEPFNGAGEVRYMLCGELGGETMFVPCACGMTREAWECSVRGSIFA
jgi:hypothetical protein